MAKHGENLLKITRIETPLALFGLLSLVAWLLTLRALFRQRRAYHALIDGLQDRMDERARRHED